MYVKLDQNSYVNLDQTLKIEFNNKENPYCIDFYVTPNDKYSIEFDSSEERENFYSEMIHFYETGKKIFDGPIL